VALIDQLASALDDLPVREEIAERPAATADTVGGLVDFRVDPRLLQPVRRAQAREPGTDDDHAARGHRCPRSLREDPERGRGRTGHRRVAQKAPARDRPILRGSFGRRSLHCLQQWCSRHDPLLSPQTPGRRIAPICRNR
jgi:hypothetical protein